MKSIIIRFDENNIESSEMYILGGKNFISNVPEEVVKKMSKIFNKAVEELQNERLDRQ